MGIELTTREKVLLEIFYHSKHDSFRYTLEKISKNIRNLMATKELGRKGLIEAQTGEEIFKEGLIQPAWVREDQTYYSISRKGFEYYEKERPEYHDQSFLSS